MKIKGKLHQKTPVPPPSRLLCFFAAPVTEGPITAADVSQRSCSIFSVMAAFPQETADACRGEAAFLVCFLSDCGQRAARGLQSAAQVCSHIVFPP